MTAVGKHRRKTAFAGKAAAEKHVAEHRIAAVAVIEIDRRGAMAHRTADVAPEIVADDVARDKRDCAPYRARRRRPFRSPTLRTTLYSKR